MVKRPHEQDGIDAGRWLPQSTGIADPGTGERMVIGWPTRYGLLDVERHWVDEVDRVPLIGQPVGVDARATTDIEHHGRRRWEVPGQEFLRPQPFKLAPSFVQAVALDSFGVVPQDLGHNGLVPIPFVAHAMLLTDTNPTH
jgi:hypothetical protein